MEKIVTRKSLKGMVIEVDIEKLVPSLSHNAVSVCSSKSLSMSILPTNSKTVVHDNVPIFEAIKKPTFDVGSIHI